MSVVDRRPSVALTMLTLVPGSMGGSETYARALTRQLAGSQRVVARAYVAEVARGFSGDLPETVVDGIGGGATTKERLTTLARGSLHRGRLLGQIGDVDVVHAPFTVPLPRPRGGTPFVQTLLDVQHLELPGLFTRQEKEYRRFLYDRVAQRADAVITISHAAKAAIVERLGVDPARISVAHLGVDTTRYTMQWGPREDFVFYPARGWAHKNHRRLIEAVGLLRAERPELRLVLTGGALESLGPVPDWVDVRGLVSADELASLYATAGCLAFPSLYEGFGLPPLEAMASGCPVAASTAGSVPEICGDAAVLFDPLDVGAIADGVRRALDSDGALLDAGLARVAEFTWERCATVHEDVYTTLAAA